MKEGMKKTAAWVLAGCVGISLLAGCGKDGGQSESSGKEGGSETVSLRFLDTSPSDVRQAYFEDVFSRVKEDMGIEITYESTPLEDAANKIMVMATSNSLPDIVTAQDNWLGQFTSSEWILPLDEYLSGQEDKFADTVTKIVWANQKEMYGNIYTVPDGMMVKGIYIRKDWCEEAGIDIEDLRDWTYDDYFEVIRKLTNADRKQYGMTYRGTRGAFDVIMTYLQGFTGGRTYDEEGNCLLNSDECLKAFEKFTSMYKEGYAPEESINWGFVEMVDNFCGGLTGTLNNDSEVVVSCQNSMDDSKWTVLPIPSSTKDGKIYNTVNAPYSYTISKDCRNQEAAWSVIEYLSQPENNIEYCRQVGMIPVMKEVGDDPLYGEDGVYDAFVEQLNNPDMVVPTGYGPFDSTDLQQGPLYEEIQKYLLGEQDAGDALDSICGLLEERMKTYLDENDGAVVDTPKTMQ
ncbi:sugar ABC transporter substrate-binding protein [Ruminococcus sp. OA3]|uniref:ABC transporter substrate-binding protein n=1 Tax=Ruminococcus sp. OA3 TaxID=2914164 RepID=UPI001F060E3F|nr:sugar ABC transporter substrate-binding protein [Ruminococcus sp. OA3]MCH1984038.1 sugar ABC transporter substrate-binding protein [Ruminococcus sp. OA3]